MTHDHYPQSSSRSPEEYDIDDTREKLHALHQAIKYLKARWTDYEAQRRDGYSEIAVLHDEIKTYTTYVEASMTHINTHLKPELESPTDLLFIAFLQQEVDDSIARLKML